MDIQILINIDTYRFGCSRRVYLYVCVSPPRRVGRAHVRARRSASAGWPRSPRRRSVRPPRYKYTHGRATNTYGSSAVARQARVAPNHSEWYTVRTIDAVGRAPECCVRRRSPQRRAQLRLFIYDNTRAHAAARARETPPPPRTPLRASALADARVRRKQTHQTNKQTKFQGNMQLTQVQCK